MKKDKPAKVEKSLGTVIAEEERAKANSFSDEKRDHLLSRAMALIYGGKGYAKTHTHKS